MYSDFISELFDSAFSLTPSCDDNKDEKEEKKYDFTNKEDVDEFCKVCDDLKKNSFVSAFLNMLYDGKEDYLDDLKNLVHQYYEKSQKEQEPKSIEKPVEEKKVTTDHEELPVESKLQIHKLVQEYIDKVIKPQVAGQVSTDALNDAYAAFYDFSCWLMSHK